MRPILLQSHSRALTKVRYNHEGDLLFTASKDSEPHVWRTHNGELLGTYIGHSGVIWTLDVATDSRTLLSGSGDMTCKVWDVETGKIKHDLKHQTGIRCVDFAMGSNSFLLLTDRTMGHPSTVWIYSLQDPQNSTGKIEFDKDGPKPTIARWSDCNERIFVGMDNGLLAIYSAKTLQLVDSVKIHEGAITDFQFNQERSAFVSASKDHSARLFDSSTLAKIKEYLTERPVNSAAISPIRDEVMLGGGQEAMHVTTTATKTGKFEVRFYDAIFEQEVGRVKGHFGPINTVAYHPQGTGFASGAEDGYVRLHSFDRDYYEFSYN